MGAAPSSRRLAAILAADVVGLSRLIGADEPGTLAKLAAVGSGVIDPQVAAYGGRVFKTTGDGVLVEFSSGVQAVQCAIAVQKAMREHEGIELRIGLHSADVTVQPDGDLLGDGVNIAARLEVLAEPGGICISGRVREDTAGKLELEFRDLGDHQLKNIGRPIRIYAINSAVPRSLAPSAPSARRLSIVVLPFANLSNDPDQEYFADGITEDLTTDLSRIPEMLVISRNTAFTYRSKTADTKQIGRELGVRYVLEGSVRRLGDQIRVNAQLIDAQTDAHLWAERFDNSVDDLFAL